MMELGDGAEGGDVGSGAKGGFVELEDRVEGGDVGGGVELGEDLGLRVWRE